MRVLLVLALCASATSSRLMAQAGHPPAAVDAIYAYTDDAGRLVYANRLQDVPLHLRPHARRVDQAVPPSADSDLTAPLFEWTSTPLGKQRIDPVLYQYRGRSGRTTYTNLADSVPLAQRASSRLDLSQVPLNSKLGAELDQQLKAHYDKLRESPFCRSIQEAVNEPFWRRAWKEHAPLVVCGGAILAFLLVTPWMVRKVGGAPWARALSLAVPVLGFVGLASFVLMKSGHSISQLRERALPCDPATWATAARGDKGLVEHLHLLSALNNETKALEQIHAESL